MRASDSGNRIVALSTTAFLAIGGCGSFLANQLASLGGGRAGQRGTVRVLFINNTPYQAAFTYGTYDQFDPTSEPDFAQFTLDSDGAALAGGDRTSLLSSSTGSALDCARVLAVGSQRLLDRIASNVASDGIFDDALVEGVAFFDVGEDGAGEPVERGVAAPLEALLGVDFPCGALLIFRFENDTADGGFRIEFELIPAE